MHSGLFVEAGRRAHVILRQDGTFSDECGKYAKKWIKDADPEITGAMTVVRDGAVVTRS